MSRAKIFRILDSDVRADRARFDPDRPGSREVEDRVRGLAKQLAERWELDRSPQRPGLALWVGKLVRERDVRLFAEQVLTDTPARELAEREGLSIRGARAAIERGRRILAQAGGEVLAALRRKG